MRMERSPFSQKRFPGVLLIVFLSIAAVIMAAAWYFYVIQKKNITKLQYQELDAVAELKARQITKWRMERIVDGEVLFSSPIFVAAVDKFFQSPGETSFKNDVMRHLQAMLGYQDYGNIYLLDAQNRIRLSMSHKKKDLAPHLLSYSATAFLSKKATMLEIHRGPLDRPHIDVVVPLVSRAGKRPSVMGIVVLQVDPEEYLFPLIQSWPTPSPSAETLLVRRDGNDVVFLNDLRHREKTALALRMPADSPDLPAARAVSGHTGIVEGIDYRGVPVIAAVRRIQETDWYIVSKIDTAEIFEPVFVRAVYTGAIAFMMILAAAAIIGFKWQRERVAHYGALYESEMKRQEDHVQAEIILRESEERYRDFFKTSQDSVFITTVQGDWIDFNESMVRIFGYADREELKKLNIVALYADPEEINKLLKLLNEKEYVHEYAALLKKKDGTLINALITGVVWKDAVGTILGYRGTIRDVTERKRQTDDLQRILEELRQSNTELQQFAYIASHDLQEPLRMVSSFMQLLGQRYKGKLDKDADDFIGYAVEGSVRMQRMVNDLLTYSRIGTKGKAFEPVDVNKVLSDALANLKLSIEETGAAIVVKDLPVVDADASQLVQVFQNLIGNSIKFRGGKVPEIHIHAEPYQDNWLFCVRDNGIGIEKAYAEKIFIIFQRLHTASQYPGSGIGLTICKKIIERHKGRIWVESEPGKGALFYFTLPRSGKKKGQ